MSKIRIHLWFALNLAVASVALGARWIGVKDAPDIQKRILEEIKRVNEHSRKI